MKLHSKKRTELVGLHKSSTIKHLENVYRSHKQNNRSHIYHTLHILCLGGVRWMGLKLFAATVKTKATIAF